MAISQEGGLKEKVKLFWFWRSKEVVEIETRGPSKRLAQMALSHWTY